MKVTSIRKMTFGHMVMELSDGSVTIFGRGEPQPNVKVGDEYPPMTALSVEEFADKYVQPCASLPSEADLDAVSVEQQAAADTEDQAAQAPLDEQLAEQPAPPQPEQNS